LEESIPRGSRGKMSIGFLEKWRLTKLVKCVKKEEVI
jgi:hypothetical protein